MMFDYPSDYLAEKLRENWLTRSTTIEQSIWNFPVQDDSLTNLDWLQNFNIHEYTSTGVPFSPRRSASSLHLSTTTTITTTTSTHNSLSQHSYQTHNSHSTTFNHYKRNDDCSISNGLQYRHETDNLPFVNYLKHLSSCNNNNNTNTMTDYTSYSTPNDNTTYNHHNHLSSIGVMHKQCKNSSIHYLNNTIHFYPTNNPARLDHTPISSTMNTAIQHHTLRNTNNNNGVYYYYYYSGQPTLNTVQMNCHNSYPSINNHNEDYTNGHLLKTPSHHDTTSNINIMNHSNPTYICSLRNGNTLKLQHYYTVGSNNAPNLFQTNNQPLINGIDMNLTGNSSTTLINNHNHNHNNSSHLYYNPFNTTDSSNSSSSSTSSTSSSNSSCNNIIDNNSNNNPDIDYTTSLSHHNLLENNENYQHLTQNNRLFVNYDTMTLDEKNAYQFNENCRPVFNAHTLIYMAMNALKKNKITLNDICEWIEVHFAFYRCKKQDKLWWQDIIRKHLTSSRCFQRVPRRKEELHSRNDLWRIHPELQKQLLNNRITNQFLCAWQNQTSPRLTDLNDIIEQNINNHNDTTTNNNNDSNILNQPINSSLSNLTEQEQCDLHELFNDQETHSIFNDHFYYASTSSISSFDLNDSVDNNDNNNNDDDPNQTNNPSNHNHGTIVEELLKASGLNEIPPLNDELIDPLDLTIHSVNSRLTNDCWWSNNPPAPPQQHPHPNHLNDIDQDCLSESMTNFINSTLNQFENRKEVDDDDDDIDNEQCTTDVIEDVDDTDNNDDYEKLLQIDQHEDVSRMKQLHTEMITNELSLCCHTTASFLSNDMTVLLSSPRLLSLTSQIELI
ncbi:unnamed protein product [Schistosoma turkestanicum]|nr:unnamed protein product [Schistosoma turkestanicum]